MIFQAIQSSIEQYNSIFIIKMKEIPSFSLTKEEEEEKTTDMYHVYKITNNAAGE